MEETRLEEKRLKRGREEENEEEECEVAEKGACDCSMCLEKIVRNANLLLERGFVINFADNGPGGYGFGVDKAVDLLDRVVSDPENFTGEDWTYITKQLKPDVIEKMVKDVVPSAWTGYCSNDEMIKSWREFFPFLK